MTTEDLTPYLAPTIYLDGDHPAVVAKAYELTGACPTAEAKLARIYTFVRELPYDILGRRRASDVLQAGTAFCMGKASSFVALCRAVGIPARVGFQQLHCPDKPFMSEEVKTLWGDRVLPWHSLGEAHLNGRWLKLDATIPSAMARAKGRPYEREFDGQHDIYSVEGPVVKELGHYADYPREVAEWYEAMAHDVMQAVQVAAARSRVATDERLWRGPESGDVQRQSSGAP
jgi:transglutaminase-like putative cysteine protease